MNTGLVVGITLKEWDIGYLNRRCIMKCFYFKSQDISEAKRDENGIVELTEDNKTILEDYYSIQLKVPKKDCSIDWRGIVRWAKMELIMPWEVGEPNAQFTKIELYKGCLSILEGNCDDLREKIREEVTPLPDSDENEETPNVGLSSTESV